MTQLRRPTNRCWRRMSLALVALGSTVSALAHADLDQQIAEVSAQLLTNGPSAELLLRRAELHRRHAEPARAHADLDAVEELKSGWPVALLARARTFQEAGNAEAGRGAVELFLAAQPGHPDGLIVRARCRVQLRSVADAVGDYSQAIAQLPTPLPDILLERARCQAALGRLDDVVAGLDEGMAKLGAIPSLELPAIEYERQRANFDGALARVDKLVARYPRKEPWLTLRAEVLEQAGRLGDAQAVFQRVLTGIEAYSPMQRHLDLTRQLESRAREGLARVQNLRKLGWTAGTSNRP